MRIYQCWGSKELKRGYCEDKDRIMTEIIIVEAKTYAVAANRAIKRLFGQTRLPQINLYMREVR